MTSYRAPRIIQKSPHVWLHIFAGSFPVWISVCVGGGRGEVPAKSCFEHHVISLWRRIQLPLIEVKFPFSSHVTMFRFAILLRYLLQSALILVQWSSLCPLSDVCEHIWLVFRMVGCEMVIISCKSTTQMLEQWRVKKLLKFFVKLEILCGWSSLVLLPIRRENYRPENLL